MREPIREYLKKNILIADGANGTFISSLAGRNTAACETYNLTQPEIVRQVHRQYLDAGATMITTNTFCANALTLELERKQVDQIIAAGYEIALKAAEGRAYVAADIGPVSEEEWDASLVEEEYRAIADAFIRKGAEIFIFETFAAPRYPLLTAAYIRQKVPDAFIIASFAVLPDGHTRLGVPGQAILSQIAASGLFDAAGFNCCSGPAHLLGYAQDVDFGGLTPSIMPNAGYPYRQEEDVLYPNTPAYFAQKLSQAAHKGFKIIGGCCGTTPEHIRLLSRAVALGGSAGEEKHAMVVTEPERSRAQNRFRSALESGKKVIAVELDPPAGCDFTKFDQAARELAACGVDAITVADSPMARPRADSVAVASRIRRLTGLEVIPHLSCRDKNINAIKSALLAAYADGIRSVLAVTGDPVPDTDRGSVKSVFNLNSVTLSSFIGDLNRDLFSGDEVFSGCALNLNARNFDSELRRLQNKLLAGAGFVMTQPLFTPQSVEALRRAKETGIRVLAGILTPVSYRNAVFLANEMPGINLPQEAVELFSPDMTREQGEETGIALSIRMVRQAAPYCDGFYFIPPFNRISVIERLLGKLRKDGIISPR